MTAHSYDNPESFKQALEQRLRNSVGGSGEELGRRRQLLVFDRFVARAILEFGDSLLLKGGLVVELRLGGARATRDVDLRLLGKPLKLLERLQKAGRADLGDFLTFEVADDKEHSEIVQEGMKYGGRRFRVECKLAGKIYGYPFGVDVGFGDPIYGKPDEIDGDDLLRFAGIKPPRISLYPLATHIAEKLHAYTMKRKRPNSRVKDLPDIALLASVAGFEASVLSAALKQTFEFRGTHDLPAALPQPPDFWRPVYERMAKDDDLQWKTLDEVYEAARTFLDPVLDRTIQGKWSAKTWKWRRALKAKPR